MQICLTALIKSKPEHTAGVLQVLENMVVQTRMEPACIQYDLHQSLEDVNLFVFYEIWENQEGLDQHFQQPYILEFGLLANEKLAEKPEVYLTRKIEMK
jgi:quinol monooxygenase YgiN